MVANENSGFLVSERGCGYTWSGNSQANRLTPWNNDPVTDEPSEVIYLRDDENLLQARRQPSLCNLC